MKPWKDLLDRLPRVEQGVTFLIALEEVFPAVAPAHHLADATGILNSRCARHTALSSPLADGCKQNQGPCNGGRAVIQPFGDRNLLLLIGICFSSASPVLTLRG